MTLRELFAEIDTSALLRLSAEIDWDQTITAPNEDARTVTDGEMFLCVRGTHFDGHTAIEDAVMRGAAVIVLEDAAFLPACTVPWMLVQDVRALLLPLYLAAQKHPERTLHFLAVTGTNGKTSVTYLLEAIFRKRGKCAVFGTVENRIDGAVLPSENTTPSPRTFAKLCRDCADAGVRYVIIEASSHALAQKRLAGITFQVGIFLNLTEDHLDYHKTTEQYFLCKRSLFFSCATCLFNIDDPYGQRLAADPAFSRKQYTFSAEPGTDADFSVCHPFCDRQNPALHRFFLRAPDSTLYLSTLLCGDFIYTNVAAAAACAYLSRIPADCIVDGIMACRRIPGRMECITSAPCRVYVDYAHTPDALYRALSWLRGTIPPEGTLWVLFGCGGDREREKRPKMGRIAAALADHILLTADNSRTEPLFAILSDIISGIAADQRKKIQLICSRKDAIRTALSMLQPKDVLLLAGKGHETYEIDSTGRHPFSERELVEEFVSHRG